MVKFDLSNGPLLLYLVQKAISHSDLLHSDCYAFTFLEQIYNNAINRAPVQWQQASQ